MLFDFFYNHILNIKYVNIAAFGQFDQQIIQNSINAITIISNWIVMQDQKQRCLKQAKN